MRKLPALALLVLAGNADSYRLHLPVQPVADAPVQRVILPAAVMAALQKPDLSDLRILDAQGRELPMARLAAHATQSRVTPLKALPILGASGTLKVTGLSLRPDGSVVQIDGMPGAAGGSTIVGILFDTREIAGYGESVTLYADIPVAQPIALTLASSDDLTDWRPLAQKTVYRAEGTTEPETIDFPAADLRHRYLRLTWKAASPLVSPMTIHSATLATVQAGAEDRPIVLDATLPPLTDARTIEFAAPVAVPTAALRITPAEPGLIPLRILGRNDREQRWTPIGSGTAYRIAGRTGEAIALEGGYRFLRIEADARTPGFATAPAIRLEFAPVQIAFLAAGPPPFTLAAGLATASDAYLPLATLRQGGGEGPIPRAVVTAAAPAPLLLSNTAPHSGRRFLLWAVLLLATAILAAMAWILFRRAATPAKEAP